MLVKGEEDSRVYCGKTVGTTQHKRRYDLCSNLSIFERCFRYDCESAQRWTNKPLTASDVWIGIKPIARWLQHHRTCSFWGRRQGANIRLTDWNGSSCFCSAGPERPGSEFPPPVLHFPSCSAGCWGFFIQAIWIILQTLFCIFSLLVINCRVNTIRQAQAIGSRFY